MKNLILTLGIIIGLISAEVRTISERPFLDNPEDYTYSRGIYLIILGASSLEPLLSPPLPGGDFIKFKQSQGYTVDIKYYPSIASNNEQLKEYLQTYSADNPQLEYVLFIGDVDGAFSIPSFEIPSYNEPGQDDVTDYEYTYSDDSSMYEPQFFIGRWPIQASSDLLNIKVRTIQYSLMENIDDKSYLDNSLIVAGNYKTADGAEVDPQYWPVTPRWTSLWIQDRLENELLLNADTVFFSQENQIVNNPEVGNFWNEGVGLVNYRGWGNATGWIKPEFKRENIDELTNGWKLPIVFSYVCNTGDFGNDTYETGFGEKLLLAGSFSEPKGAAAMIGPSDLDTDTRFNNVMTGGLWDELIEGRISELAPLLHAGKQSLGTEFEGLEVSSINGGTMSIPKFYHHIYNVLGDPSIPVWLGEPNELIASLESNSEITESFVSLLVSDGGGSPLQDVVGAILNSDGDLIGKGLSNQYGELNIEFSELDNGSEIELYLNAPQFMQKKIDLTVLANNGGDIPTDNYTYSPNIMDYTEYSMISSMDNSPQAPIYEWIEINETGTNLELTDDSQTTIDIGFDFKYFGQIYSQISVCSNGWVSFEYLPIDHFWNFSIPFPMGPDAMIAPFMDDLDDNGGTEELNVYSYLDAGNNQFIIEWDDVINGEDDDECGTGQGCTRETFQLILKDGNGSNGDIIFQYKEINDIDENGNYSTIGIESPDQNFGYQYQFRNLTYAENVDLVSNSSAILFTTNSIVQGCMDSSASNYDETANVDDGSCEYQTVQIGHQVWMQENLKATHYNNGDAIPTGFSNEDWSILDSGAYSDYNNNSENSEIYGRLYNFWVGDDSRGVCPEGWHMPTDSEFSSLTYYLAPYADVWSAEHPIAGGMMKESGYENWNYFSDEISNEATNESGFTGLPGGYRDSDNDSDYYGINDFGYFWSRSNNGFFSGRNRRLNFNSSVVGRSGTVDKNSGHSIRCLSDETQTTTILVPENFVTIQEAIDYSIDGDTVLVSAGTYYENINFNGKNIALIGEDRETTIIDGGQNGSVVIFNQGESELSLISHFTIQNGLSISEPGGGGILIDNSSPTLRSLIITSNTSLYRGGGIALESSSPTLIDVMFSGNAADNAGGMYLTNSNPTLTDVTFSGNSASSGGGGMLMDYSSPTLTDVTFSGNTAEYDGGGMYLGVNSNPTLTDVTFSDNTSIGYGGGMHFYGASPTLTNVTFSGNTSTSYGGGMYIGYASNPTLTNVTFSGNAAYDGGGMALSGASPTLTNSILWGNLPEEIYYLEEDYPSLITITYSDILDGEAGIITNDNGTVFWGDGNIDADPQFTDPDNGDYTLQPTSPCIDAGDPASELDPDGTIVDMGAYPFFHIWGCTDSLATNYDSEANTNDSSCYGYPDNGDYSLSFDGEDDSIILYNSQDLSQLHEMTATVTINPKNNLGERKILWRDVTSPIGQSAFGLVWTDGEINFCILSTDVWNDWRCVNGIGYFDNRIYTISGVIEQDFTKLYIDGELIDSTETVPLPESSADIKIGSWDDSGYNFNGFIDEVSLINKPLNQSEILLLHNDGFVDSEELLAYYKFNAGEGNILYDHSGNGNHGTIYGATWKYEIPIHSGANLISFMSLPEDNTVGNILSPLDGIAEGIIGQGEAASPNPTLGWVGSLTHINPESGYWLKVNEDVDFNVTSENVSDSDLTYSLNSGANLISYPSGYGIDIDIAIPDSDGFDGIIGEGIAASSNPVLGWVGSLVEFEPNHGYWFKVDEDMDFQYQYGSDELSRRYISQLDKDFNQSTQQAFYFIEDIENIEVGDIVSSYCNDTKVGSRVWNGSYTDIPAMGNDNSDWTKDYCTSSSVPTFRVEKPSGETYALTGDIPVWESNGLHMLSSLQEAIILPESYSLAAAYPNPFNPTTTINFAIPSDSQVSISVYNLQGREVVSLASGSYDAGYHQVIWNADSHSSGVYFVKMVAGSYVNTQKLMLVK